MTQVQILDVGQYLPFVPIEYPDKCCVLDNDTSSDFEALPFHVQTEEMRSTETSFQLCIQIVRLGPLWENCSDG